MLFALIPTQTTDDDVKIFRTATQLATALISVAADEGESLVDSNDNEVEMDEQSIAKLLSGGKTIYLGSEDSLDRGTSISMDDEHLRSNILLNVLSSCDSITVDDNFIRELNLTDEALQVLNDASYKPFSELCDPVPDELMQAEGLELAFIGSDGMDWRYSFTIESLLNSHAQESNGQRVWNIKDDESGDYVSISCHAVLSL